MSTLSKKKSWTSMMILELKVVGILFMQSSTWQRLSPVAPWQREAAAPLSGRSAAPRCWQAGVWGFD